jgi:hypothetical protein
MLIGFLHDTAESPSIAGPEFSGPSDRRAVIDLEQFVPICDADGIKQGAKPPY